MKWSLKALGTAALVTGMASAASAVSFTVVIDKIEMVEDASNYTNTAKTVYDPINGIGESATKTVDLFNATQKLGTSFNLADIPAGIFETAIFHVSSMNVVSGSTTLDLKAQLENANTFGTFGGNALMVLGEVGSGANSVATVFTATSMAPMQPVNGAGTTFTLPTLNIGLESTNLIQNGTGDNFSLTAAPTFTSVATNTADDASIANVKVEVDFPVASFTGFVNGASQTMVGLFTTDVPSKPVVSQAVTGPSPSAIVEVEFVDVPKGNVVPIAWVDADADGLLDAGEEFTVHHTTIATAALNVSTTTDASYTLLGGQLDTVAAAFPAREATMTIRATRHASATYTTAAETTNSGISAASTDAGGAAGTDLISLTIVYQLTSGVSRTVAFPARAVELANVSGGAANTIQATDTFNVVLDGVADFTNYAGVSFDETVHADHGNIVIANVPVGLTTLIAGGAGSTYAAEIRLTGDLDGSGAPVEAGAFTFDQTTNGANKPVASDAITIINTNIVAVGNM